MNASLVQMQHDFQDIPNELSKDDVGFSVLMVVQYEAATIFSSLPMDTQQEAYRNTGRWCQRPF